MRYCIRGKGENVLVTVKQDKDRASLFQGKAINELEVEPG